MGQFEISLLRHLDRQRGIEIALRLAPEPFAQTPAAQRNKNVSVVGRPTVGWSGLTATVTTLSALAIGASAPSSASIVHASSVLEPGPKRTELLSPRREDLRRQAG